MLFICRLSLLSRSARRGKRYQNAVEKATKYREATGKSTVVFVDEVHRFSKSQQDAFLPHVESGLFTFYRRHRTENPSFEVISALLSRSNVYVLESLSKADLNELLESKQTEFPDISFEEKSKDILFNLADGDAETLP